MAERPNFVSSLEKKFAIHYEGNKLPHFDALIVLGKNIGVEWTAQDIERQRFHLSPHSRINTLVSGLLYQAGVIDKIIFSTGTTGGSNKSEADLMADHLQRIFPDIPDEAIILEDLSWDTNTNARVTKNLLRDYKLKNVALMTVGFHLERAVYLFERAGVLPRYYISSEDVLGEKFPKFLENYIQSELYEKEIRKEEKAIAIQKKLLPELLSLVSWIQRVKKPSRLLKILS